MNSRKAQGLSMNVIIIAAIALVVLVVLIILVVKATDDVFEGTSCESKGGYCVDTTKGTYFDMNAVTACTEFGKDKDMALGSPTPDSCGAEKVYCCRYVG